MPGVAVSISLHAWLIPGFFFLYFSGTSKETRQNQATAPINVKIIHSFWVLRGFVMRENRKNLGIDWEKMYSIHLKLESN